MKVVTCIAPVNIAIIKYWGKKDEELIIPLNNSFSATLSTKNMCAKTTIMASPSFTENKLWLNGKEETLDNKRLHNCLKEVRKRAQVDPEILNYNLHICSVNNFPTAAGLASSASGYACLIYALAQLYKIEGDISAIARLGSGSACRSVLGGWVEWEKGVQVDGSDSIALQIFPADHWPEMRVLILVVNDARKKYSSAIGMKKTAETSELLKYRVEHVVPERIAEVKEALLKKDFHKFAEITMKDSNTFHACCLDTYPPLTYKNDVSHAIAEMVHAYNDLCGENKVAYTFDAGPNACLFLLEKDVAQIVSLINYVFPRSEETAGYFKGDDIVTEGILGEDIKRSIKMEPYGTDIFKYIIYTSVGSGPELLNGSDVHLLNGAGNPK